MRNLALVWVLAGVIGLAVTYAQDSRQIAQESDARLLYRKMLEKSQTDIHFPCPSKWGGLYGWNRFFDKRKNIDAVSAASIAIKAAWGCYGSEMAALPPRLVGNNGEYWLVYCFPFIVFEKRLMSKYDNLVWRYENGRLVKSRNAASKKLEDSWDGLRDLYSKANRLEKWTIECYYYLMWRYEDGRLFVASNDYWNPPPGGFQIIAVLISNTNGQVLYMMELL